MNVTDVRQTLKQRCVLTTLLRFNLERDNQPYLLTQEVVLTSIQSHMNVTDVRQTLKQRCVLTTLLRFNLERDNQPYLLHKTLFWRQFNVIWTIRTSDRRWNNVVCLLPYLDLIQREITNLTCYTRRCFDVNSTSFERYGRQMDVETTSILVWAKLNVYKNIKNIFFNEKASTRWINSTTHRRIGLQYTHSILRSQRVRWKLLGEEGDSRDGRNERPRQDVRKFRFVLFDGRLVDKKLQSFRFVGHAVRVGVH